MWYEKPLRIAALQCESEGDSNRVSAIWREMGFNVEQLLHVSADAFTGYYREDQEQKIREYVAIAKERGLRIIFYHGMLGPEEIWNKEEWAFTESNGKPVTVPCINSPFRDWYAEEVRKIAALDIDGLFIDGPFFPEGTCYCEWCRAGYRERYGVEPPTAANPQEKAWRDFVEFRYDSVAKFIADMDKALKEVKPDAIIYSNGQPLGAGAATGRDNRRCVEHEDMLGAEGGFIFYTVPGEVPWWKPGIMARLLESQCAGKPTVIFIAGDHKTWNRYLHTAAETRLLIADTVANGASPWYGIHSVPEDLQGPGGQAAGEMMRFLEKNEEFYTKTTSVADVALLWSTRTADYYDGVADETDFNKGLGSGLGVSSHYACYSGFCELLLRLHVPFDIIDEQTLFEDRLSKYKTVILPNAACLSEAEVVALKDFVRDGGNLVSTLETSLYDENICKRTDFGLSAVFGVGLGENVYQFGGSSYMGVAEDDGTFVGVYPTLLPAPTVGLEVKATSALPLALFREPVEGQYRPLTDMTTPAIVVNEFGKGKSFYFAGNFGQHFKLYGIVDYMRILGNALNMLSSPLVQANGLPETVEVVLRVQKDAKRLMLHLVNFTGTMRRPISEIVPVSDASIEIPKSTLQLFGIEGAVSVHALKSDVAVGVQEKNDVVSIALPKLFEYEALVISGQGSEA